MSISKYFTWKEALWLPQWKREANASDGLNDEIRSNLEHLFNLMDLVREHFNAPIVVHVAHRPAEYNKLVKGAKNSAHLYGMAVDFHVKGLTCEAVRKTLIPKLEELGMRMEDLPGSNWVHLDTRAPATKRPRFFKP